MRWPESSFLACRMPSQRDPGACSTRSDRRGGLRTGEHRCLGGRWPEGAVATIVRSGSGGMDLLKAMAVAAAASVPFSSTITLAPWSAAVMKMPLAMAKPAPGQNPSGQSHANRSVGGRVCSHLGMVTSTRPV